MSQKRIINYIKKVFMYNLVLFPFMVGFSIVLFILEAFTYKGIVDRYLFFPVEIWFYISNMSSFIAILTLSSVPSLPRIFIRFEPLKYILVIIASTLILIYFFVTHGLIYSDQIINYGGRYLIYPDRLSYAILLAIILTAISILTNSFQNRLITFNGVNTYTFIFRIASVLVITIILISSVRKDAALFIYNVKNLVGAPMATYETKMNIQIGSIYNYYSFVNSNTPESAVILYPKQQSQWPHLSNEGYTRYFVYPRNLVSEEDKEENIEKITHVFIIGNRKLENNESMNSWPNFKVPALKVTYYRLGLSPITVEGDFIPGDTEKNKGYWGIIEVRKGVTW